MKVIVFYEDGYKQMYDVEKISSETLKQIMENEEGAYQKLFFKTGGK